MKFTRKAENPMRAASESDGQSREEEQGPVSSESQRDRKENRDLKGEEPTQGREWRERRQDS